MNHLGYASSPAILQYLKAATDYGLDPNQILADNQISLEILSNDVKRITGEEFQRVIAYLAKHTQDPCFGLKSSRYVQAGSYSVLGYMVMNCKSLKEAIRITPVYEQLVGDMGHTDIHPLNDGSLEMRWHCHYTDPTVRPHMIAHVLGSWINFARFLTDKPSGNPRKIYFEFEQPNHNAMLQFQSMFQCPMEFNCEYSALIIDQKLLALPMRQPDEHLLKTLENHADILMANISDKQPLPMKTKNAIKGLLIEGIPRKEMVAKRLGMSERTMQRRLQQFETSYQTILDDVRLEQAMHLLTTTELSIQDIAARLGFSEPRSFHRCFKGWLGMTPGEFRKREK